MHILSDGEIVPTGGWALIPHVAEPADLSLRMIRHNSWLCASQPDDEKRIPTIENHNIFRIFIRH